MSRKKLLRKNDFTFFLHKPYKYSGVESKVFMWDPRISEGSQRSQKHQNKAVIAWNYNVWLCSIRVPLKMLPKRVYGTCHGSEQKKTTCWGAKKSPKRHILVKLKGRERKGSLKRSSHCKNSGIDINLLYRWIIRPLIGKPRNRTKFGKLTLQLSFHLLKFINK